MRTVNVYLIHSYSLNFMLVKFLNQISSMFIVKSMALPLLLTSGYHIETLPKVAR